MKQLLYDGSYDGFLSAIFEAFAAKSEEPLIIKSALSPEYTLFDNIEVKTEPARASRVESGIKRINMDLSEMVYKAWLSEENGIDDAILSILRLGFAAEANPMAMRYEPSVRRVESAARKVGIEIQRALQFIRFTSLGGLYIADYEPQYDIIHAIGAHFHGRFASQRFIIRDLKRNKALISDERMWWILILSAEEATAKIVKQDEFAELWKSYFSILANPQRRNLKLQQHFIPLRYRKHLTEFI